MAFPSDLMAKVNDPAIRNFLYQQFLLKGYQPQEFSAFLDKVLNVTARIIDNHKELRDRGVDDRLAIPLAIKKDVEAIEHGCNNPDCTISPEVFLIQRKLMRCARCKLAHYCSRDCQRAHWKEHKTVCVVSVNSSTSAPSAPIKRKREES